MNDVTHHKFLSRAIELSYDSLKAGGFPVAAILVRGDTEISVGLSSTELNSDVTAHAEMQAIRAAGAEAMGPLVLYTSLEPCMMCLAASSWAGVSTIVYGCKMKSVHSSYYINTVDASEVSRFLVAPPEFIFIDSESKILPLIHEYEKALKFK